MSASAIFPGAYNESFTFLVEFKVEFIYGLQDIKWKQCKNVNNCLTPLTKKCDHQGTGRNLYVLIHLSLRLQKNQIQTFQAFYNEGNLYEIICFTNVFCQSFFLPVKCSSFITQLSVLLLFHFYFHYTHAADVWVFMILMKECEAISNLVDTSVLQILHSINE